MQPLRSRCLSLSLRCRARRQRRGGGRGRRGRGRRGCPAREYPVSRPGDAAGLGGGGDTYTRARITPSLARCPAQPPSPLPRADSALHGPPPARLPRSLCMRPPAQASSLLHAPLPPPRFPDTHRARRSAGVDGEVGLCLCVCPCVRLCIRLLPVTSPMCEGWRGVGAAGCSVGTGRQGGRDPELRSGGGIPAASPRGGQGSCEEEEDGGGRRGAPSSRRAGCTGVCPARRGTLLGGSPPTEASPVKGCPGPS